MAGFCVNLCICALVMLLSSLTGTDPHTYVVNQLGVLGWFSTSNSQSAILSVSAPVVLMLILFIFVPALNAGTVGIMVPVSVLFTIAVSRLLYKRGVL